MKNGNKMIRIANWLLTRKCNLDCDYCAIVKNYSDKPNEYPDIQYYHKHQMNTEYVIEGLKKCRIHNPDMFHIFYGGEPLLRKDLGDIIEFCNKNKIHYTIISNNSRTIEPLIRFLFEKIEVEGFTASIDPVFLQKGDEVLDKDRWLKSIGGVELLSELKPYCKDVVAEITVTNDDVHLLYELVKTLSEKFGINSDITFVDIAKTPFYDFSNIKDENLLVKRSPVLAEQFQKLMDSDFDIHMKNSLLPIIWEILPSELDCSIEKSIHNITIDSDGSIRLCLRIRGVHTPKLVTINNLLDNKGKMSSIAHAAIKKDKREYCKFCNHTCQIMSKLIDTRDSGVDQLIHSERRK
jgi:MoaA/NifB/PqqE/SkfB family radical SAM enzyme